MVRPVKAVSMASRGMSTVANVQQRMARLVITGLAAATAGAPVTHKIRVAAKTLMEGTPMATQ